MNRLTDSEARKDIDTTISHINLFNVLMTVLLVSICGLSWNAKAEEPPIQIGSEQQLIISVCFSKEDAMKVVDAMQQSKEAADKVFDDNSKCTNVPMTFKVGNVVYLVNVGAKFFKVVEITSPEGGPEILYWLTSKSIVKYKVDVNS